MTGKDARDEDFPVASLLLPAAKRRHVMAFYRFARHADDIADDPALEIGAKLARLSALETALEGGPAHPLVTPLTRSLTDCGMTTDHARHLLQAFRADAENRTYESWDDLIGYCAHSAMPVGGYLLDLFGETAAEAHTASDALCAALQVTNHLKDIGPDYRENGRLYIPLAWLAEAGLNESALQASRTSPALRGIIDRLLDQTADLLKTAQRLPRHLKSRSLARQASVTIACANRLLWKLRRGDPLAEDLALTKSDVFRCLFRGMFPG
ncbi:MAG: squalene/phytoene synthase family protein [Magnetospiraceae bacterium]